MLRACAQRETQRVTKAGGFIAAEDDMSEPRVWLDKYMNSSGLAMTRSLGDSAFTAVGVTPEPEISHHQIRSRDEFFIMATDGVWSVFSSQEAVDIVDGVAKRHPDQHLHASRAAQDLVTAGKEGAFNVVLAVTVRGVLTLPCCRHVWVWVVCTAARSWKADEGDYRDDITCLVIKLPCLPSTRRPSSGAAAGGNVEDDGLRDRIRRRIEKAKKGQPEAEATASSMLKDSLKSRKARGRRKD